MNEYLVSVELRVNAESNDQAMTKAKDDIAELLEDGTQLEWYTIIRPLTNEGDE